MPYIVAQVIGAIVAAAVLYLIASGQTGVDAASSGTGGEPQNSTSAQQPERNDCVNMANRAQEIANDVGGGD